MRSSEQQTRRHRPDYWLVIISVVMLVIGVIVVYSISPALAIKRNVSDNYFLVHQLIALGLGAIVFGITASIPTTAWRRWYKPLIGAAAVATLVALIMPVNPDYPAQRWVRLGGFSFQAAELVKFALLMWLAVLLTKRPAESYGRSTEALRSMRPLLFALGGIGVIVAGIQSDLGSAGVMVALMAGMAFIAGVPMRRLAIIGGIIVLGTMLAILVTPYRRDRVLSFLHPASDCQVASGYQACQAIVAVGSGGMIGLGLGSSVQASGR